MKLSLEPTVGGSFEQLGIPMGGCNSKKSTKGVGPTAASSVAPVTYQPARLEPLNRQLSTGTAHKTVPVVSLPAPAEINRADSMLPRQQQWWAKVKSLNRRPKASVQPILLAYGYEAATIFPIEELQKAYQQLLQTLIVRNYPTKNRADDLIDRLIEREEFGAVEMAAQFADIRCCDPKTAFEYVGDRLQDRDRIERYTDWFMEHHQPTIHLDV